MDNLDELAFAYQLTKNQVSALDLLLAHEKKLIGLRRFLLAELRNKPTESVNLVLPYKPETLTELIPLLVDLVNSKRKQEHKEPLAISY